MTELIKQKALEQGIKLAVLPVECILDVKDDMEKLISKNLLNRRLKWIEEERYNFKNYPFQPKSIVTAVWKLNLAELIINYKGKQRSTIVSDIYYPTILIVGVYGNFYNSEKVELKVNLVWMAGVGFWIFMIYILGPVPMKKRIINELKICSETISFDTKLEGKVDVSWRDVIHRLQCVFTQGCSSRDKKRFVGLIRKRRILRPFCEVLRKKRARPARIKSFLMLVSYYKFAKLLPVRDLIMDREYEERVVKSFFTKRLQERILFELSSPKKRRDAIWRLCHNSLTTLNEKYMIEIPKPNSDYTGILRLLKEYGAGKLGYCISLNTDIDGKHLPIAEALKSLVGFGLASIISCIPNSLAYFEEEQSYGTPSRYILKRD